ncbi:glycosyltransferase family 2 protein [Lysinibacillus contaminans]|uniref:glycosyltransferase family 2 protein n=1 Tax=Lysinibacillus contaminans TaxID=1293441 RepID=UPI0006AEB7EA|nr:glycosyltransferase family 2 protein [Lysinibacillus contaminans]
MSGIDIVVVVYNSSKWLKGLIQSLEKSEYPLKDIHLTFVDNASSDDSVSKLLNFQKNSKLGSFNVHDLKENIGFGRGNNFGFKNTKQPFAFFLNVDTEVLPNTISELMNAALNSDSDVALWECRQFPYEHPKFYNPVTLETSWASAAACLVKREYFTEVGGFDQNIFMYAEDVDLSWRFRAHGYKLQYVPKSVVYHYTYQSAGEVKPNQFYNSTFNNLMLRYKFGTTKDILKGYLMYNTLYGIKGPSDKHKSRLLKGFFKSIPLGLKFGRWNRKNKKLGFKPNFRGWDYELIRDGAFYVNEGPKENPLISVIVRTCGRPNVLRETLKSLENQTYNNIQVVIVEDGPDISKEMIEKEFLSLNYIYQSTVDKVGRCEVGNIALSLADGEYFNFLDDDDVFYADHIEVLINTILNNPQYDAAYSLAFETPIRIHSLNPYIYDELFHNIQYRQKFNKLLILNQNYFPIQTVLFSRKLYDIYGGFDLELEYLEDWDLWIRYTMNSKFLFVEKVTSIYRVPAERTVNHERQQKLDEYLKIVKNKHKDTEMKLTVGELREEVEGIAQKTNIVYQLKNTSFKVLLYKAAKKVFK